MPILVNRTFEEFTPESVEDGECSNRGFVYEKQEFSFRELVGLMRECSSPSNWPASGCWYEWYSTEVEDDYITGESRRESIHYAHENPDRMQKYWLKAARAAGIVK